MIQQCLPFINGGMQSSDIKQLKQLEEAENRKLKEMHTELSLNFHLQQEIIKKL